MWHVPETLNPLGVAGKRHFVLEDDHRQVKSAHFPWASPRPWRPVSQAGKPLFDGRCSCRWQSQLHPVGTLPCRKLIYPPAPQKLAWGKCGTPSPTTIVSLGSLKSTPPHGFSRCRLPLVRHDRWTRSPSIRAFGAHKTSVDLRTAGCGWNNHLD